MFESKFCELINETIQDCIDYGRGQKSDIINGAEMQVTADWADNEKDIEVAVYENRILRISFMEQIPEEYR